MRITNKQLGYMFKRLGRAMEWPTMPAYENGKPNVGAVSLSDNGYGWNIEIIRNEGGGVDCPFSGWKTKRDAYEGMAAMAQAVEHYKQENQ